MYNLIFITIGNC